MYHISGYLCISENYAFCSQQPACFKCANCTYSVQNNVSSVSLCTPLSVYIYSLTNCMPSLTFLLLAGVVSICRISDHICTQRVTYYEGMWLHFLLNLQCVAHSHSCINSRLYGTILYWKCKSAAVDIASQGVP